MGWEGWIDAMARKAKGKKKSVGQTHKRGVPIAQYMVVYRAVQAGKITWKEAEDQGLVGKISRRGPKSNRFNEMISKSSRKVGKRRK